MIFSPLVNNIVFALLSLVLIMFSASKIISAVTHYARKLGISNYLIGFVVVSIGTSVPELTTAFVASVRNAGSLVLGNVIGANIIDVTIVLGITAIVGKKIFVHGKVLTKTIYTVLVIAILPLILGIDGTLSRVDGAILIASFVLYIYNLLRKEGKFGHIKKDVKWKDIWKDMIVITISLIVLLISANILIMTARDIGHMFGIPEIVLGLFLVALGTTIPELTVEVESILKGKSGIAFGDILGSVVCNSSLVLGFAAVLRPIKILNPILFRNSALFMVLGIYIALIFIKKQKINWQEGIGLLLVYATFLITEVF